MNLPLMAHESSQVLEPAANLSSVIAKNTYWNGLDSVVALLAAVVSSIAVARVIGPTQLAHFSFVNWITLTTGNLASLGLPLATRKYMAEYLGRSEGGIVRAIYSSAFRKQALLASTTALAGLVLIFTVYEAEYRSMATVLVISLVPQMISYIPSQANNAAEQVRANVRGSFAGMAVYVVGVLLSLKFGWSVVGIAFSNLFGQLIECGIKLASVAVWISPFPKIPLPNFLKDKIRRFSHGSATLAVLNVVVWNRSDMLFLRFLSSDIRQIAFFSLPFSLIEKVLMIPQALTNAIVLTLFAERGRNAQRMVRVAEVSLKFVLLLGVPLLIGLAALSKPLIAVVYGSPYSQAAPVLTIVAILAISKVVFDFVQPLYLATEKVPYLLKVTAVGGVLNMALDVVLVPVFGALGAACANGVSQTFAAAWLCLAAIPTFGLKIDGASIAKVFACGATMGVLILSVTLVLRPSLGLPVGTAVGAVVFLGMTHKLALVSKGELAGLWQSCAYAVGWRRPSDRGCSPVDSVREV